MYKSEMIYLAQSYDKDCIEDMRVYFTERDQMVVDHAASIRAKGWK